MITTLIGKLFNLIEQQEIHVLQSDCALVYWGKRAESHNLMLVDIENPKHKSIFKESVINELSYVQPDFMLFQKNKYTENKWNTRTAGCPDLIIEIWSDGNTDEEKAFKKFLYSTSDKTEHWYIEQDSNEVTCFLGKNPLPAQSLSNILKTGNGIEFDLRRIAV
jgi:Uma2 family endonuclease